MLTYQRYLSPPVIDGYVGVFLPQIDHISGMSHAAGGLPHGRARLSSQVWQL